MADTNEIIKISDVKTHISNLEGYFEEFSNLMKGINEFMADRIDVGPESAVFGEAGKHLWTIWDENASTFGDFYANFDTWSKMVAIIMANGLEFTEETVSLYRSKGSNLAGIQEKREKKFLETSAEGVNASRGKEHVYYDENGNKISVCIDDETGKPYYKTVYNADGTSTIYRYDKDGNMSVVGPDGNVKYYSADGKELLERPETFRESGLPYSDEELLALQAGNENDGDVPPETDSGSENPIDTSSPVTVSSGQEVKVNGKNVYFLMRDSSGNRYFTASTDSNAQVMILDESGELVPYSSDAYGGIVSREAFVKRNKNNLEYSWRETYNGSPIPYESVGTNVDSSFTASVSHPDQTFIINDYDKLTANPAYLKTTNFAAISNGSEKLPEVIYVAPGETIRWDPTDFLDLKDIKIEGGSDGRYLVLDPSTNTYYTLNSDGTYFADGGGDTDFSTISAERLLSEHTTIKTK